MDKKQITGFVEDPSRLNQSTLPVLADLVKQFPFCQTIRLLHLYNLKITNNINYDSQLKVAAIYSADRKKLYALLHDEIKSAAKEEITPDINIPVFEESNHLKETKDVIKDEKKKKQFQIQ